MKIGFNTRPPMKFLKEEEDLEEEKLKILVYRKHNHCHGGYCKCNYILRDTIVCWSNGGTTIYTLYFQCKSGCTCVIVYVTPHRLL